MFHISHDSEFNMMTSSLSQDSDYSIDVNALNQDNKDDVIKSPFVTSHDDVMRKQKGPGEDIRVRFNFTEQTEKIESEEDWDRVVIKEDLHRFPQPYTLKLKVNTEYIVSMEVRKINIHMIPTKFTH